MSGKHLLICVTFLTIAHTINAEYDVNGFCTLVKDGTQLGSIDSCQTYYTCRAGKAIQQSCSSNQSFDKNVGNCRPSSEVNCYHNIGNPCSGKNNVHVPLPGTCGGWVYCQNNVEAGRGQCGSGQVFINGACNYGNCKGNGIGPGADFKTACSVVPNNVYFGSNLECDKWQLCQNDKLSTGECSNGMIFDVQLRLCNYFNQALCTRVTGNDIQPDGDGTCKVEGAEKPSASFCSTYLMCRNGNWIRFKCQVGLFYDVKLNKCVSRRSAQTSPTCDRCEGSKKSFVNGVDPECRKYYSCEDGARTGTSSCINPSTYFNEVLQACVKDTPEKQASYQLKNGACYKEKDPNKSSEENTDEKTSEENTEEDTSEDTSEENTNENTSEEGTEEETAEETKETEEGTD